METDRTILPRVDFEVLTAKVALEAVGEMDNDAGFFADGALWAYDLLTQQSESPNSGEQRDSFEWALDQLAGKRNAVKGAAIAVLGAASKLGAGSSEPFAKVGGDLHRIAEQMEAPLKRLARILQTFQAKGRIEITDDMLKRAHGAYRGYNSVTNPQYGGKEPWDMGAIRAALEAALNGG